MNERQESPYATPDPWNLVSAGYAEAVPYLMEKFSLLALERLPVDGREVIDVAAGPGTLSIPAAKKAKRVRAFDFAHDMLDALRLRAQDNGLENIEVEHADCQTLPVGDGQADAAFSMFGLMFFSDRGKGFSELNRVLRPGGRALVSSWVPIDEAPAMRIMFGALQAADPSFSPSRQEVESLEDPEVFQSEMSRAGFTDISVERVSAAFEVMAIEPFWEALTRSSVPLVILRQSVGSDQWAEYEQRALNYLREELSSPCSLETSAWFGVGTAT